MSDNKYGRVFTEADVGKILLYVTGSEDGLAETLAVMDEDGVRFKFEPDEPLFVLRGHDKRAAGAIKHYMEHQAPNAPVNHTDAIQKAYRAFTSYREANAHKVREPD